MGDPLGSEIVLYGTGLHQIYTIRREILAIHDRFEIRTVAETRKQMTMGFREI